MRNCWTATSYAEYHRNGCTHAAYSPGCRPLGSHSRLATTPSTMPRRLHRYKTLPARAPRGRYRYKTLPARPKFGAFCASRENFVPLPPPPSRAGRIFYRIRNHLRYKTLPTRAPVGPPGTKLSQHARNTPFRRILRQQGELCTAYGTTYGTKLSPLAAPAGPPGTKLSRHAAPSAHPVQNSPSTPKIPLFSAFCASRESFIPLPPPPSRAGRKKSRTGRAKRGGASPYNPRNALIAGISRTAWTRPAR